MNPLISVIVPIYNSEKYLKRCIESIIHQSYKNLEIILINDGSTDGSLAICEAFSKSDERIKLISQQNSGVSEARNRGLELAKGDFIGFVDSDDYIDLNLYETLIAGITLNVDLGVLISHTINPTPLLNGPKEIISSQEAMESLLLLQFPTSLWAYLYRKEVVKNIRLNSQRHFFEDFEFNIKVLLTVRKIFLCQLDLYHYESNFESINSQCLNDKKMSCLTIYDDFIQEKSIRGNAAFKQRAAYFRSYFFTSMLLSFSKSLKNRNKQYEQTLKKNARSIFKETFHSIYVPLVYKVIIGVSAISPVVVAKSLYFFKRIKKY